MGRHQYNKYTWRTDDARRTNYIQHDDREASSNRGRKVNWRNQEEGRGSKKVSFHSDRRGIRKRGSSRNPLLSNAQIRLQDDDESMDKERTAQAGRARPIIGSVRGKFRGRGRGRGYIVGANLVERRNLPNSIASDLVWHKVVLNNASKFSKEDVLQALMSAFPTSFAQKLAPICFDKVGMNYVFYVEWESVANVLTKLSVFLRDCQLSIRVERSGSPRTTFSDEMFQQLTIVMDRRYTPVTKALDLKSFHTDQAFLGEPYYVPLSRSAIMKKVVQVIVEHIPEVEAIDLSDNRIASLDTFSHVFKTVSNLKVLYLSNNRIEEPSELECLKGLKLIDFKLENNLVMTVMKDSYTTAIRKLMPTLQRLDGQDLPKLITFEDETSTNSGQATALPEPRNKMICDEGAGKIVLQFLEQYFKVYDSDNRQGLLNAYHENAVMSMSCSYPRASNQEGMKEYTVQSRNLLRVSDQIRRQKLLNQGRLSIISFLTNLPKTTHDLSSFTLDLPFATATFMTFTVSGVFKERSSGHPWAVRHFSRTFLVVPEGSGFCIINEALFITTPTPIQAQKSNFDQCPPVSAVVPQTDTANQLISTLSQKTGMNAEWAKRCLEETGWNIEDAEKAFRSVQQEGKIPLEAFTK